jgi:hypothetical protein
MAFMFHKSSYEPSLGPDFSKNFTFMNNQSSYEPSLRPNPTQNIPFTFMNNQSSYERVATLMSHKSPFGISKSPFGTSKVILVYSCIPADIDCCLSCYDKMSDNARKQLNLLAVYNREDRGYSGLLLRFLWCDLCSGIINMSTEDQGETKLQVALRLRGTLSLKQVIRAIEPFDWPYNLADFRSGLTRGGYSEEETREIYNGIQSHKNINLQVIPAPSTPNDTTRKSFCEIYNGIQGHNNINTLAASTQNDRTSFRGFGFK